MRTSVRAKLSDLNSKLMGYVTLMSYRYCHMCVKAEPASLLSMRFVLSGETYRIEDVADVYPHDKEEEKHIMDLFPKDSKFLQAIMEGVRADHPEFELTLEKYDKDAKPEEDTADNRYVRLTMPAVDKNRRDALMELIKAQYNMTCGQMDAVIARKTTEIAVLTATDDPSAMDEAKKYIEEQKKQYTDMREQLTEDKKKEVEEAYLRSQGSQQGSQQGDSGSSQGAAPAFGQSLKMD